MFEFQIKLFEDKHGCAYLKWLLIEMFRINYIFPTGVLSKAFLLVILLKRELHRWLAGLTLRRHLMTVYLT